MKHKNLLYLLSLVFIASVDTTSAQDFQQVTKLNTDAIRKIDISNALKVGDQCPDILFPNMINYKDRELRLSAFQGKCVVIDFWATWCGSCVAAFPKVQELQSKYQKDLQFILVSHNEMDKAEAYFNMKPDLTLISSTADSKKPDSNMVSVFDYFPHTTIPHYVWINREGVVTAVTGSVNEENIKAFIEGKPMRVGYKDGIKEAATGSTALIVSNASKMSARFLDTTTIYQRMLTRYDPDAAGKYRYITHRIYDNRVINVSNKTIAQLYTGAFGGIYGDVEQFNYWQVIVEVKEPVKVDNIHNYTDRELLDGEYEAWMEKNTYCYKLFLPEADSSRLYALMREDLDRNFGYDVRFENRKMKCLVLKSIGPNIIRSKGGGEEFVKSVYGVRFVNCDMSFLSSLVSDYQSVQQTGSKKRCIFLDETGIKGNIDISFKVSNMKNTSELRRELRKYNLDFAVEEREMKVLVIRDRGK